MGEQHHDFPKTTASQIAYALLVGFSAPAIVVFLLYQIMISVQPAHDEDPAMAATSVEERIKPVATVDVVAEASTQPTDGVAIEVKGKSGEEVYNSACITCHGAGLMGAPKLGDNAGWAPRIAQGYETLVQNAIKGIRMMPAKGGNPSLTDAEVAAAVVHMANQSGAEFTSPN